MLRVLTIDGATALTERELLAPHADLIGREVRLSEIFAAAEEMTARYRRAGFVLSRVVVPAQEIRGGAVRLAAVEGFISSAAVAGLNEADRARAERRLAPLLEERPLRAGTLERQLLLINDLPGIDAGAVLAPSSRTPGGSDLTLDARRDALAGYAAVDNRGADLAGPEQASLGVRANSALGFGERISLRGAAASPARELRYGEAALDLPMGDFELGVRGSYGRIEPSGDLADLDIVGRSRLGEIALAYPAWRSRAESLVLRGRFTARNSEVTALDQPLSRDELRVVALEAQYDSSDAWRGVNLVAFEFAQGLEALGASDAGDPLLSRANGRPDFSLARLSASRLQSLGGGLSLLAEASGQYAFSQLLAAEEFGVGGARFGRAYDPSEIAGDHGFAAAAELRDGVDVSGDFLRGLQLYGFADFGAVWRIDAAAERRASLASAGVGMRVNLLEDVSGSLELAWPLTATPAAEDDKGPRLFFSLTRRFERPNSGNVSMESLCDSFNPLAFLCNLQRRDGMQVAAPKAGGR